MTTAKEAQESRAAFPDRPRHICKGCNRLLPEQREGDSPDALVVEFGPDPYAEEIGGDETEVWECIPCRHESAWDI